MEYRRARFEGGTYFFTLVTHKRREILTMPENVVLLRNAIRYVMDNHPFKIDAFILLPDHLHCIWTLPQNDFDFSMRWRLIKSYFSRNCAERYKIRPVESRRKKKEQAVWQQRFWEHTIKNDRDFERHVEYIHYNPVKHGFVKKPSCWEFSSFHRYVKLGQYDLNWGAHENITFNGIIGNE